MEKNKILLLTALCLIVVLVGIAIWSFPKSTPEVQFDNSTYIPEERNIVESTPSTNLDLKESDTFMKKYTATLKTTKGDIKIELNSDQTPKTVGNFVTLAKKGFYNGTIFHRVISGFMIQGGDPTGTGAGGPGYKFADEPFTGEYLRGTIAMANSGPNTNGSQFFIMHKDYPLPKNYVIFGKAVSGLEVVDAIATSQVTRSASGEMSKPVEPVKINSVEIVEAEK